MSGVLVDVHHLCLHHCVPASCVFVGCAIRLGSLHDQTLSMNATDADGKQASSINKWLLCRATLVKEKLDIRRRQMLTTMQSAFFTFKFKVKKGALIGWQHGPALVRVHRTASGGELHTFSINAVLFLQHMLCARRHRFDRLISVGV